VTSAASLAAGLLGAVAPGAQAATPTLSGGQISLHGGNGVELVNPDGSGLRSLSVSNYNFTPNWSSDGSRLVAGWSQLQTTRATGDSSVITLPWAKGVRSSASYEDPTFWLSGRYVVFSTAGQLAYGPSDGSWAPQPLLTATQESSTVSDLHPTASPNGDLAFERQSVSTSASLGIWTYSNATDTVKQLIASGSSPVFSADGGKLAFIRVVNGWSQIFTANADGTGVTQVTTDATPHNNPTWDPAGGRIAYDAPAAAGSGTTGEQVYTLNLTTGTSTAVTAGSNPAWQPLRQNSLDRIYANNAVGIDGAASHWTFDTVGAAHQSGLITARSAVLVNKGNGTYAAPATTLAAEKQGPVLLTSGGSLDSSAITELRRSVAKGGTVYLEGGTNLLSSKVASQVQALGYTALRMDAPDLSSLSVRVAQQISRSPSWVFVADGTEYHDPIAAAAAAGSLGYRGTGVVLLTRGKTMPSAVQNYLNALNPSTTHLATVGGNAKQALQNTYLKKAWNFWAIEGGTHEAVAANLAAFWWYSPVEATVEDTWNWQNAVVGNAVTATYGPVLWSTESSLSAPAASYLSREAASIWDVQTFGGSSSYSPANRTGIAGAIAASSAWTSTVWASGGDLPKATSARSYGASTAASPATGGRPAADPSVVPGLHLRDYNAHTAR
jgi:hypothetical protein